VTRLKMVLLLAGCLGLAASTPCAYAQTSIPAWQTGTITAIYADPSDVVIILNVNGPCGGNNFDIQRSNTNFSEYTSLMYTAAAEGKSVGLYVTSCSGTRNFTTQGMSNF